MASAMQVADTMKANGSPVAKKMMPKKAPIKNPII